jgi:hypothetical protein
MAQLVMNGKSRITRGSLRVELNVELELVKMRGYVLAVCCW